MSHENYLFITPIFIYLSLYLLNIVFAVVESRVFKIIDNCYKPRFPDTDSFHFKILSV